MRFSSRTRIGLSPLAVAAILTIAAACSSDGTTTNRVITVTEVVRVSVTPASASVDVGAATTLQAVAYDAAGAQLSGKTATWSSSASGVATVSAAGEVTGVSVGSATIDATIDGRTGSAAVTVTPRATSTGTITVDGSQRFQTMTGWEALADIGHVECDPRAYQSYKQGLLDRAANEVGINRIRIGLRNGYENPTDQFVNFKAGKLTFDQWKVFWYRVVNDNADPFVINLAGFNWGYFDFTIDELIVPLRQRLAARGESLWVNMAYNGANTGQLHRDNPEEYAEFVLAAFQHLKQKYGWVPNSLEIVNEPNLGGWSVTSVGQNLLAAKRRLNQAGFFPDFVGPSASSYGATLQYFDQLAAMPGVVQALDEISYHRYGQVPTPGALQGIAQRGARYGLRTAMLEHGGSGHDALHADLTAANVSAWEQFGLASCSDRDIGGVYFPIYGAKLGTNAPDVRTGAMTKYLRQYFRYVAHQAVRVGASTSNAQFAPVAFRNANGKFVVVVKASAGGSFSVGGLPAGTYGIDYTTANEYMRPLGDVNVTGAQSLSTTIPAAGVLTVFAR